MISKTLNKIGFSDLEDLVKAAVQESKTIEYKQEFPGNTDSEKKEFLADVSSFANSSGGDLIFGIKEQNGIPIKVHGVNVQNTDQEIRRYENLIRTGIEPRITLSTHHIKMSRNQIVFIFRVLRSWSGPHRVIFGGRDKFYARNSAGKYPLDTSELRSAFNLSQTLVEKIGNFRTDRVSQLFSDNTPVPIYKGTKIALHLIPFESFVPNYKVDLAAVPIKDLSPIYCMGWSNRINLDGLLTFEGGRNEKSSSYVQLYRNGVIEAVSASLLVEQEGSKWIPSSNYEKELLESFTKYLEILKKLGVNTPIVVFLTLIDVMDYKMLVDGRPSYKEAYKIDREILQLPEAIIESYETEAKNILRPLFDLIWNACGYERSLNFDDSGNWVDRR